MDNTNRIKKKPHAIHTHCCLQISHHWIYIEQYGSAWVEGLGIYPCHGSIVLKIVPLLLPYSCILSKRSCGLTWYLVMTLHIQRIIAQSLHCRWCKSVRLGPRFHLHGSWHWYHCFVYIHRHPKPIVSSCLYLRRNYSWRTNARTYVHHWHKHSKRDVTPMH